MITNPVTQIGICKLCPTCSMNTQEHYLHKKLIISYCDCRSMGGLYVGFSDTPFWKLYADMQKDDFFNFARSADTYVDMMRELHHPSQTA